MFEVELHVMVSAKAHRHPLLLVKGITLPSAPFPGLVPYGVMDDASEPILVESVVQDMADRLFWCEMEDDQYPTEDERADFVVTMADKLSEYGNGWEVREPGSDDVEELAEQEE